MSSMLGTTLSGRYRLDARIGSGGMATVYRALDQRLERPVAVKVMKAEVATDSGQLERFRREARAVAQLSHANVVGVIDAGDDDGRPYIVFEYVDGETLKQRIHRSGALPIAEALGYAIEIARALRAAHARHIVHRDVKPQNVLIDARGSAKVTDFGIARTLDERGLTDDGRVLGTTDYVSPEQALGHQVTGQSDLYSLGIVLYEMLTGELPFNGEAQVAVAVKHVHEPLPDVRAKRPEVSSELAQIVRRATAKRPEDRYRSDQALIAELEQQLALESEQTGSGAGGEITAPMRVLSAERRPRHAAGHGRRLIVAASVLTAAAAVAIIAIARSLGGGGHDSANAGTLGTRVAICAGCAAAYNPDGLGSGPNRTAQNNPLAYRAVDGDPSTAWVTETYYGSSLGKPGVGIYVTVPSGTQAVRLKLFTRTPGFTAKVYGTDRQPDPNSFNGSGWIALSHSVSVTNGDAIHLRSAADGYRHYLVWITQLPPGEQFASVNEIELYRR